MLSDTAQVNKPLLGNDSDQIDVLIDDGAAGEKDFDRSIAESEFIEAEGKKEQVSVLELFQFADGLDFMLICIGMLCSVGSGAIMPAFALILGETLDAFYGPNPEKEIFKYSMYFVGVGVLSFFLNLLQNACLMGSAERQAKLMREEYFRAVLRQEIGWFDTTNPAEIPTRIKGDVLVIQIGIGTRMGQFVKFMTMFLAGFTIGFIKGWQLTLVMLGVVPLLAITVGCLFTLIVKLASVREQLYGEAGAIAEQALSSIRTVAAFNGQSTEVEKYNEKLDAAEKEALKSGHATAISVAMIFFIIFASYGMGMWFGAGEVADDLERHCVSNCKTGGTVLTVFWAVLMGAMSIGQMSPAISAVGEAKGAFVKMKSIISRRSAIDVSKQSGSTLPQVSGTIELRNVSFSYPSRPDVRVFDGFNLNIEAGKTIALVGSSGSGKSTVVNFIQRFYDPLEGSILLDGRNIKDLNLKWLREQIGLVSQEPILFSCSVLENIKLGKKGCSDEEAVEAAKSANAHDFISSMPNGYHTTVGERGAQLSGGQKQRLAIARAIVRDPKILLLDEATSALDNRSEKIVQQALDNLVLSKKRTTIIIAHRLSTVRNADQIVVIEKGVISETGTHEELMAIENGKYKMLVLHQQSADEELEQAVDVSDIDVEKNVTNNGWADVSDTRQLSKNSLTIPLLGEIFESPSEDAESVPMSKIFNLSRPERSYVIVAVIAACIAGAAFPGISLLLSDVISMLYSPSVHHIRTESVKWAFVFLGVAICMGLAQYLMINSFVVMGERLTRRLRKMAFEGMLRQDIGWFDDEEHSTGKLTANLATEIMLIKMITGQNLGRQVQNLFTIITAFFIAFYLGSWELSLILCGIFPFLLLAFYMQTKVVYQSTSRSQEYIAKSSHVTTEAIEGIRSVVAFGIENDMHDMYSIALEEPKREGIKKGWVNGLAMGFAQMAMLSTYGLIFWYGGHLVLIGAITFQELLRSLLAIMMSASNIGENSGFIGDSASAKSAAARVFAIVDRVPTIDSSSSMGETFSHLEGSIEFKDIEFAYPTRPRSLVLRRFNFCIEQGSTVAFVGESGCGKSTIINLLERFYEPRNGTVSIGGVDLKSYNLQWMRSRMGLVSQEPILFTGSIEHNIAYGKPGASSAEVIEAAKMANAHSFISGFPNGYQTEVGDKGVQLSGGQKQRIAIARAIIRNPDILLLDEATSALDSESERVVQDALDSLLEMRKRTTIVIAHRYSTIKNADVIAVVRSGKIVEFGTHTELLSLAEKTGFGYYKALLNRQLE